MYKENRFDKLSLEQTLLILTSRLNISEQEKIWIKDIIIKKDINWFEFYKLALYHKTVALCWKNINQCCVNNYLPKYLRDTIMYLYKCTEIRNQENIEQVKKIVKKFSSENILCIPVKGAYLIPNLYKDYGIRYSGDMDFLVKHDDIVRVKFILNELGYVNGSYNSITGRIDPLSRTEELKWKIYMSNLPPFYKLSDNSLFPYFKLDFRFALDDRLDYEGVNEIIEATKLDGYTLPDYYFIHLCTHFYSEAKHRGSIVVSKDLNIIKLCDIREFFLKYLNGRDYSLLFSFVDKYKLEEAIYFVLKCLDEIYNDGYENELMKKIKLENIEFLNTYGESTIKQTSTFSAGFWDRFFSCGNINE